MTPAVAERIPTERFATPSDLAAEAVRTAAHLSHEARLLKSMAADAIEDGVRTAKRSYRIAVRRFEDAADEAATCIRQQPFKAVSTALGAGLLLGIAGAWFVGRTMRRA